MKVQAEKNFRTNLRNVMAKLQLSQRDLAEKAGSGQTFINRVLNGKSSPSIEFADRIADAVGVSLESLITNPKNFSNNIR